MQTYLGLDLSTQGLTAIIVEPLTGDLKEYAISFDESYPGYGTRDGVLFGDNPAEAYADPRMFIEAVDDMLALLSEKKLTGRVAAIAVSAQQHGSVYLNDSVARVLKRLDPGQSMHLQLERIFSRSVAPIWMDSSTGSECDEITEAAGGLQKVVHITGSPATERFAGPQIRKFWKIDPSGYEKTAHITLISAFITALLTGHLAPLDAGDGYGANLADIRNGCWHDDLMRITSPDLADRLPRLVTRDVQAGKVSNYLVHRYGFQPGTDVLIGSGDNPNSLVGLGLIDEPQIKGISLGTSDTYFGYMQSLKDTTRTEGHVFGTADGNYMFLLCFKNGSLAREAIRNEHRLDWHAFSDILLQTKPGNNGRIMLPYYMPEITPLVVEQGVRRYGNLAPDDPEANVRAVAEAQIMSMYLHSEWTGQRPGRILVTAGGSGNMGLLNVIAQVFNANVQAFEVTSSAALGAAVRAAHWSLENSGSPTGWKKIVEPFTKSSTAIDILPDPEAVRIYHEDQGLLSVYAACEKYHLGLGPNPDPAIRKFKEIFPA